MGVCTLHLVPLVTVSGTISHSYKLKIYALFITMTTNHYDYGL